LFDSEFLKRKKEGQPDVINKIKEPYNAGTYPFGEPYYSLHTEAPKKVPLSVFSKGINLTIFRRSMPNCGAS
jgi:hypothetical protein